MRLLLATRDIPIVLLTGSNYSTQADGDAAGAEALVRKPFSPLELLAVANGSLGPLRHPVSRDEEARLRGAAPPVRAISVISSRSSARSASCFRRPTRRRCQLSRALSNRRTRGPARTRSACSATRSSSPPRSNPRSRATRARCTASSFTTSARSGSRQILQKPRPLSPGEERLMRTHTVRGEQVLGGVAFPRRGPQSGAPPS